MNSPKIFLFFLFFYKVQRQHGYALWKDCLTYVQLSRTLLLFLYTIPSFKSPLGILEGTQHKAPSAAVFCRCLVCSDPCEASVLQSWCRFCSHVWQLSHKSPLQKRPAEVTAKAVQQTAFHPRLPAVRAS